MFDHKLFPGGPRVQPALCQALGLDGKKGRVRLCLRKLGMWLPSQGQCETAGGVDRPGRRLGVPFPKWERGQGYVRPILTLAWFLCDLFSLGLGFLLCPMGVTSCWLAYRIAQRWLQVMGGFRNALWRRRAAFAWGVSSSSSFAWGRRCFTLNFRSPALPSSFS